MKRFMPLLLLFAWAVQAQTAKPTVADAEEFMKQAEARLAELQVKTSRASWVQENFITDDTQALAADADDQITAVTTELVEQAKRFDGLQLAAGAGAEVHAAAAFADGAGAERSRAAQRDDHDRGVAGRRLRQGQVLPQDRMTASTSPRSSGIMTSSRDPKELKDVWVGWHKVGAPMRERYARFVELSNQGAREIGFQDTGAMWRSNYDMSPEQFSAELERLWQQVRPLYLSLHTYVRAQAVAAVWAGAWFPRMGRFRADLLGNPWAQEWGNIYPLLGVPEDRLRATT